MTAVDINTLITPTKATINQLREKPTTAPTSTIKKHKTNFSLCITTDQMAVLAAQQLRAKTFGAEFGAQFADGIDQDKFDEYCTHVLVYDEDKLIATTRLLVSSQAAKLGQFYTENEFYLQELLQQTYTKQQTILELGRTCVHPDYRSLAAINMIWQGIGEVAATQQADILMGCASINLGSGNTQGWLDSLADEKKVTIRPKRLLPKPIFGYHPALPPLLKAYLRMGTLVGNKACFDPDFHCADVFIWFPLSRMDKRYLKRFGQSISVKS